MSHKPKNKIQYTRGKESFRDRSKSLLSKTKKEIRKMNQWELLNVKMPHEIAKYYEGKEMYGHRKQQWQYRAPSLLRQSNWNWALWAGDLMPSPVGGEAASMWLCLRRAFQIRSITCSRTQKEASTAGVWRMSRERSKRRCTHGVRPEKPLQLIPVTMGSPAAY